MRPRRFQIKHMRRSLLNVAQAYRIEGDVRKCLGTLRTAIKTPDVEVNSLFSREVLLCAVETKKYWEVVGVVNVMLENKVVFSPKMVTIVVAAYLRVNTLQYVYNAHGFLNQVVLESPLEATHLAKIIAGFAQSNSCTFALEYRQKLIDQGFKPSLATNNVVLGSLARAGWMNEAFKVFKEMPEKDSNSYIALLRAAQGHDRQVDTVLELGKEQDMMSGRFFNHVLRIMLADKRFSEAVEMYNNSKFRDNETYRIILSACRARSRLGIAMLIVEEMEEKGCKLDAGILRIILGLLDQANALHASTFWFEQLSALPNAKGNDYYSIARRIIYACARKSDHAGVIRVFESIVMQSELPDKTLNAVILAYEAAERPDDAIHVFDTLVSQGVQ